MDLMEHERVLKVIHHHPTPFVFDVLKVIAGSFPFFFLLYLFSPTMSTKVVVIAHISVFTLFALVLIYVSILFWLDKLVVTNKRIIHIDWKYLTVRDEAEALLNDIQDIQTKEKGMFSHFWIFDYGMFRLDTASSHITIEFHDAPDPESIRKYIYHLKIQ